LGWKQAGPRWEKNRREVDLGRGEEKRRRRKVGGPRLQRRKRKEKKGCWAAAGIKEKGREREIGRGSLRVVLGLGLLNFLFRKLNTRYETNKCKGMSASNTW
jgi:hypothetical protein